ncbi:MAG: DnaJ domain-containing protein [Deltaproteobacteria bacterium]|nr:DnaJ domain-containing protein [Deltaproteobacteria bacterium]
MIKRFLPWIIGAVYIICPYDILPDFFVGPGWLDDLAVLGLILWWNSKRKRSYQKGTASGNTGRAKESPKGYRADEKDPYEILGLKRGASTKEVKAAHKKLVAQYHPDKVQHLGPEFQQLAQEKFITIQKAYDRLVK